MVGEWRRVGEEIGRAREDREKREGEMWEEDEGIPCHPSIHIHGPQAGRAAVGQAEPAIAPSAGRRSEEPSAKLAMPCLFWPLHPGSGCS